MRNNFPTMDLFYTRNCSSHPQGGADVAHESGVFRPFDAAAGEQGLKILFRQIGILRQGDARSPGTGPKGRFGGGVRPALVEGAYFLADIASEDKTVHFMCPFLRNGMFRFPLDGEAGEAAAGIEQAGRHQCAGGTGIQAEAAAAAAVPGRDIGGQCDVDDQFAENHPRAHTGGDDEAVFALPADAGALCPDLFQNRRGIHKSAAAAARRQRLDFVQELLQALPHHLVIVASPGVAGDAALVSARRLRARDKVIQCHHDDGLRIFHEEARVMALRHAIGHIVHAIVAAARQPLLQTGRRQGFDAGDANAVESEVQGRGFDFFSKKR